MLKTRVITALILVAALILILGWGGTLGWSVFVAVLITLGLWEWARLVDLRGNAPIVYAAVVGGGLIALGYLVPITSTALPLMALSALFWLAVAPQALRRVGGNWMDVQAIQLVLAAILLGAAGVALLVARQRGFAFLFSLIALVWIADITAYFCGKAFGRRKLAPRISPGKSWEGAWGGMAGVVIYGWAWVFLAGKFPILQGSWPETLLAKWHPAMFTLWLMVLAGLSICGDLFESLLKRRAGMKDSSQLLPGHGGILDRIDAQLPVLPLGILLLVV